ncbi:MAG: hypothetical protein A2Z16_02265 [Chloroflexi bacterium RBG_16_54_18]|nr:MAG: hypothetical protein A2Z16_02265 [Chloroflexi bacterium RBG_16_54_18]
MEERLQKILARTGLGSRRKCEELISSGRVRVNGKVASLGSKADPENDRILLDGHPLVSAQDFVYIAVYKPRGVVSTTSEELGRPTVLDLVPFTHRLYPVGRLDMDSEGLVLLTNDGELANRLTHPRYGHEKEYRVLVARHPDSEQLEAWKRGVVLEDGFRTSPAGVRIESNQGKGSWLRVILREGRKRQMREMGALTGLPVVRIIRIRIGALSLGNLKPKEWRNLTPAEINALKAPAVREKSTGRKSRPVAQKTAGKQIRKYPTSRQ